MTTSELAEHLEILHQATEEDLDELLTDLLSEPYAEPDAQHN